MKAASRGRRGCCGTYRGCGSWRSAVDSWRREGRDYGWDELVAAAERSPGLRSIIDPGRSEPHEPARHAGRNRGPVSRHGPGDARRQSAQFVRCCLDSLALRCRVTLDDLTAHHGRASGGVAGRRRRQPEPAALPAHRGCLRAAAGRGARGGNRLRQPDRPGDRRRRAWQRGRGPRGRRRVGFAADLRAASGRRLGRRPIPYAKPRPPRLSE